MHTDDNQKEGPNVRARELDLVPTHTDDIRKEVPNVRTRTVDLVPSNADDTGKEDPNVREVNLELDTDVTTRRGAAVTTIRRLLEPLRRRSVRRLLTGGLVSKTGDWLTVGALMGWVYQETASTGSVALLMLVRLAPPILGGGAAAAFVDRVRRERLLVVVELMRAVALATVVTGLLSGLTILVYAAIAVSGLLAAISQVGVSALIPRLVPAEELPAANGLISVIESSAMATGAIAGGLLLSLVGVVPALVADLSTFVLAAVLFAGISVASASKVAAPADDVVEDGPEPRMRDLLADRTITTAVGALCVTVVAGGLVNATLPRFLTELGLGAGAYGYGFGAIAIGLAIGGGVAGTIRADRTDTALMGRALFATAVTFCMLAVVTSAPLALLLLVLVGVLDGIVWVVFETAMQRTADPRLLGRAFGLTDATVRTAMIGSIALAPLANQLATPAAILLVGAVVLTIAGRVAMAGRRTDYPAVTGWQTTAQN
jgi:MFS family permease